MLCPISHSTPFTNHHHHRAAAAMSVSGSEYSSEEEEFRDDMRVFLRLRPINKLEQSRRSKNCIELHEDPTLVTVDSPLEGEYDYTFDHVRWAIFRAVDDDIIW